MLSTRQDAVDQAGCCRPGRGNAPSLTFPLGYTHRCHRYHHRIKNRPKAAFPAFLAGSGVLPFLRRFVAFCGRLGTFEAVNAQ